MRLIKSKVKFGQPVLAKLKKGSPKTETGKRIGDDLVDRFRLHGGTDLLRDSFHALFESDGKGPIVNNIPFTLAGEIDEVWTSQYELFDVRNNMRQVHDCETVYYWSDDQGRKFAADIPENPYAKFETVIKVPLDKCPEPDMAAKQTGRLKMRLPQLGMDYGVIEFETHSMIDITWIEDYLTELEAEFGSVRGVPLILSRGMRMYKAPDVSYDKKTKKMKLNSDRKVSREGSFAEIHCHPMWYMEKQRQTLAMLGTTELPKLISGPSGDKIDTTTGEIMPKEDELDLDVSFMDEETVEGIFTDAPDPAPEDVDIEKEAFSIMGPNWDSKKGEILSQWPDLVALSGSLKANRKAWQDYSRDNGAMPMPASASDVTDDQKVLV